MGAGFEVPGIEQVTAGCGSTNFSSTWFPLEQPIPGAHGGKGRPRMARDALPPL